MSATVDNALPWARPAAQGASSNVSRPGRGPQDCDCRAHAHAHRADRHPAAATALPAARSIGNSGHMTGLKGRDASRMTRRSVMAPTPAEKQRRYRERLKAGHRPVHTRKSRDRRSRPQRWRDAVAELLMLQLPPLPRHSPRRPLRHPLWRTPAGHGRHRDARSSPRLRARHMIHGTPLITVTLPAPGTGNRDGPSHTGRASHRQGRETCLRTGASQTDRRRTAAAPEGARPGGRVHGRLRRRGAAHRPGTRGGHATVRGQPPRSAGC